MSEQGTPTPPATPQAPAAAAPAEPKAPEEPKPDDNPPGADALGDAGKRALDTMKADRNAARQEAQQLKADLDALKAQIEGREAEHKAAQEAQRVKDEALAAANQRILKAEVRAQAAGKLADPQDALRFLDLSAFEVGADGEVDGTAVASAIDNLIQSKPYLGAQGKRFPGDADGGARNDPGKPSQLTRADMARMTPEQIVEAQEKGQFDDLLAGRQ